MNIKEAAEIAEAYNSWEIGDSTDNLSHKEYIKAVDTLIAHAKNSVEYKHSDNPTFVEVINRVAHIDSLSPSIIISKSRKENAVAARQVISYVMYEEGFVYSDIGLLLGGRDHATILHARRRLLKAIESPLCDLKRQNPELAKYAPIINDYKVGGYE